MVHDGPGTMDRIDSTRIVGAGQPITEQPTEERDTHRERSESASTTRTSSDAHGCTCSIVSFMPGISRNSARARSSTCCSVDVLNQCLRHRRIHAVVRHLITYAVGAPAQRQF